MTVPSPAPARPRKRRRAPIAVLVVLLVLAALLVGADRGGQYFAAQAASRKLQSRLHTPAAPVVTFHGVPWLTQAFGQRFDHVYVHAQHAVIDGYPMDSLDAELYGLRTTLKMQSAVADRMTGRATVGWDAVSRRADTDISGAGDGKVRVKYPVQVMGQRVEASVLARAQLDAGQQAIRLVDPQLEVLGVPLPADLSKQVLARVVRPLRLGLPTPLRASALSVNEAGATMEFSGDSVDLMRLRG